MSAHQEDGRWDDVFALIARFAAGDFADRLPRSETPDNLDALSEGLNMLGAELSVLCERMHRSEGLLEDAVDLYENAPVMFASVDAESHELLKCNQTLVAVLGLSKCEIIGRNVRELFDPQHRQAIGEFLKNPNGADPRLPLRHKDGSQIDVSLDVSTLRDEGAPVRHRMAWRDVREQAHIERRLRRSQKMEALGRLAGGVAHDFNNVLTVIQYYSSLLVRSLPPGDSDLEELLGATERAAELVRRLLVFSHVETVEGAPVRPRELIVDFERLLTRILGEDVALELRLTPDAFWVQLDRNSLEQVLINLVVNARDAMPRGGSLTLALDRAPHLGCEHVRITVTDTGEGMSEETLRRACDPFFTTKPVGKGTGLGLSTCYRLVERAGGTLNVESRLNEGTRVEILLPAIEAPTESRKLDRPTKAIRGRERILVVEDDTSVRRAAVRMLRAAGYEVIDAANGHDALDIASSETFALVISDIVMPGIDGAELARELRRMPSPPLVLLVSGYPSDLLKSAGREGSDFSFLPKPFTPYQLHMRVRSMLDGQVAA